MAPTTPPMPSRRQRAVVRPCSGHRVGARRRRTPPRARTAGLHACPMRAVRPRGCAGLRPTGREGGLCSRARPTSGRCCGRASLGRQLLQIDTPLRRMWEMGPRARYASAGMPRDPRAGNRLTGQRTRVCPTACGVAEAPPALAAWTIHASLRPSAGRSFGPRDDTDLSRPAAPGSNLPHATFRECGYTLGGASTARLDVGRADADDKHAVRRKAPRFYLARQLSRKLKAPRRG